MSGSAILTVVAEKPHSVLRIHSLEEIPWAEYSAKHRAAPSPDSLLRYLKSLKANGMDLVCEGEPMLDTTRHDRTLIDVLEFGVSLRKKGRSGSVTESWQAGELSQYRRRPPCANCGGWITRHGVPGHHLEPKENGKYRLGPDRLPIVGPSDAGTGCRSYVAQDERKVGRRKR